MMKTYLLSFLLLFTSLAATAQTEPDSTENRFFVGIGANTTSYPIMGDRKYLFFGGIKPFVNVNYGYRLSNRATIQTGIGYGGNMINAYTSRYVAQDSIFEEFSSQRLRGVVVPVTLKYTPFNPDKRLQLYANAAVAPVFGHIKAEASEHYEGVTTPLYNEQSYTFDLVATAGLTLNYKISKRLNVYADGILFYKNFNFQRPAAAGRYLENKSVGIGINYWLR